MFAVHANGQSLYTLAGPVGLEESLPLKWFFNLAGGDDDNVNASNYNKQESAFISTDIGCSLANYDAVTQYSFSAKLGGIFYLKDLDGGTNEALSNSTLSAKLSHSFDQTLRYNGSVSFAWQPEPNYSNGIANARRDGDYIYVYVSSSVSKAWTSRYSTTLGANFSMIDYQEDSAKTDNRPEFQNMIKDGNKKLFDMIIVWKLDRFARNRYDSARYKAQLKRNGIKVVSATEVISDSAEGIILESMLEGFAEYYSVDLSEKVVRGLTDNALKCMFNGGTLPMGYVIDAEQHFQIDPVTAPYILDAFKQYDEGATMTQIRDWLNEQGMKNTRGNPLTYNSVQHLLKNRRYIGEYQYRDILISDGIPAIVPKDLFDRVQAKMEKNKKAPARHKAEDDYLLTTKLFCEYCGAYLCGESGTSRTGVVHHYYKCVSVKKSARNATKSRLRRVGLRIWLSPRP